MPFSPFDPPEAKRRRFRLIPVRTLVPNLITLLALCAGLTAIRLSVEDQKRFAELLLKPRAPTPAMKRAKEAHARLITQSR